MSNRKTVYCQNPANEYDTQMLFVSPEPETGRLHLSFWHGRLHCSTSISKGDAREFADAIRDLLEEIEGPNQQSMTFAQQHKEL